MTAKAPSESMSGLVAGIHIYGTFVIVTCWSVPLIANVAVAVRLYDFVIFVSPWLVSDTLIRDLKAGSTIKSLL